MVQSSSALGPAHQLHWDETEVVLLLGTAESIAREELERPKTVRQLSRILRMRLAAKTIPVDEKTRNEAGMHLQLHWIEVYLETGKAKNISKLFVEIARLKADAPEKICQPFQEDKRGAGRARHQLFPKTISQYYQRLPDVGFCPISVAVDFMLNWVTFSQLRHHDSDCVRARPAMKSKMRSPHKGADYNEYHSFSTYIWKNACLYKTTECSTAQI